jgi:pimeloyl-ACP methyl ester carboxylesterase
VIVEIDGARIAYDDIGEGMAIVFLHAFPLNRTMWTPQTSALAGDWRCLTIDVRGFGESSAIGPFAVDRYADDVAAVLDVAGIRHAIVVGLSMGGYIAFAFWRRHADRVRALVLADTRAGADAPDTLQRRRELIDIARTDGPAAVAERQVVGLLGKSTRERRPDLIPETQGMAEQASVSGIVGALEAMMARPDSAETLPTINVPTLILVGDEDVITPPKEARAMHAAITRSRLEVLGEVGHLSNMERPSAFNATLSEFLHSIESDE